MTRDEFFGWVDQLNEASTLADMDALLSALDESEEDAQHHKVALLRMALQSRDILATRGGGGA